MAQALVGDVLASGMMVSVSPTISVAEACRIMTERHVGAVLIFDDGTMTGIFTERDVVDRVVSQGKDVDRTRLHEVMTAHPVSVHTNQTVGTAVRIMREQHLRHLPVVDEDGQVIGVVSVRDFLPPEIAELDRLVD